MYKSLALAVLLLPFSGYAITKEQRKKQINKISRQALIDNTSVWIALLASLDCVRSSFQALPQEKREAFLSKAEDFKKLMDDLEKEYNELDSNE